MLRTWTLLTVASGALFAGALMAQTHETDRLVEQYASFAGSQTNARALVTGLREASEIKLEGQTSATFTPPTGKMGYGNVNIALSLAEADLKKQGITDPTPQQIESSLKSILDARAAGKGWGEIANAMGFKLGEVVRSEKAERHERAERHARVERPEKPQRPDRPERPERPEKPERGR